MNFVCRGDYLAKCNSSDARVIVPTNLSGICADAFVCNNNVTDLVLPENIKYCVSGDSTLVSRTIKTLTIYNSWFSGVLKPDKLPSLRRVEVLDADPQRLSSIRAVSLLTQLAQLPESVEVYFPHCNLFACDRNDRLDIKLCIKFLNSKWLYDEETQKPYAEYIKMHEYGILQCLVEQERVDALKSFISTADPENVAKSLEQLQSLEDTEITALALDRIGKSGKAPTNSGFDLGFLDDILADPVAEPAETASTSVFVDTSDCEFEIRGVEASCLVVGAYKGKSCNCFIVPDTISGLAVEGVAAATETPTASPIAIAIGLNVKALFRHALVCYANLQMLLLTQNISFIDETAIPMLKNKSLTIYCPTGSYAENWALSRGFRVKSPSSFITELPSSFIADLAAQEV